MSLCVHVCLIFANFQGFQGPMGTLKHIVLKRTPPPVPQSQNRTNIKDLQKWKCK